MIDFAYALSGLSTTAMTLISLPGYGVGSGGSYRGEELDQISRQFLTTLQTGQVDPFLAASPKLVVPN